MKYPNSYFPAQFDNPEIITSGSVTIEISPPYGYTSLDVSFTAYGSGVTTYFWDFGDGELSQNQNEVHRYICPGIYSVVFIANKDEMDEVSVVATVTVIKPTPKMPTHTCCFGPYETECLDCDSGSGLTYIDNSKSYKSCNNSTCNKSCETTFGNTYDIIDTFDGNCPDCRECYLEHKSQLGRVYTIIPNPCSVVITDYDQNQGCGECLENATEYCFYPDPCSGSTEECSSIFSYDDHLFRVTGVTQNCYEGFECEGCWSNQNAFFESVFPEVPEFQECTPSEEPSVPQEQEEIPPEIIWHNKSSSSTGQGVDCNSETLISKHVSVLSQQHPSIDVMASGHAIIAFEERVNSGLTKISLAQVKTSVPNVVNNWRQHSYGVLVNEGSLSGELKFRIYEYAKLQVGNGIGFLSGPLAGKTFAVTSAEQFWDGNQIYYEVTFNSSETLN